MNSLESCLENLKKILSKNNKTVSAAESLTGGYVQYLLSSINGSSNYFVGGVTAYNIDQKVNILGVDRVNAEKCNCVSEQTAIEMARGVQELTGSDYSIATTGYSVINDDVLEPYAHICFYDYKNHDCKTKVIENKQFTTRELSQQYFATQAFLFLYNNIIEAEKQK